MKKNYYNGYYTINGDGLPEMVCEICGAVYIGEWCERRIYNIDAQQFEWMRVADFSDVDIKNVDGEDVPVCNDCDYDLIYCDGCETYHKAVDVCMDDRHFWDGCWREIYACGDWVDENLHYCECCGNYFTDYYWDDEFDLCLECAEEERQRASELIDDYHADLNWREFIDGYIDDVENPLFGFELEVDTDLYDWQNKQEAARAVKDRLDDHIKLENDCSLDRSGSYSGFEIVSQPHDWEAFDAISDDIRRAMDDLKDYDFMSHDAVTCGLHVHINRRAFGWAEEEQSENIAKTLLIYERFYPFFLRASRRTEAQADRWAGRYCRSLLLDDEVDYNQAKDRCKDVASRHSAGRYYAVNCSNYKTVEFRLGRGTLVYESFRAWIDLHLTLVRNIRLNKSIDWEAQLDETALCSLLEGAEPATFEYLNKRKCFDTLTKEAE